MQGTSAESQLDCAAQRWTLPRPILCSLCSSAAGLMDVLAGGRHPPAGLESFDVEELILQCPSVRTTVPFVPLTGTRGRRKEMKPGSEKVRRSLPSHSEPSLPSAKSSCSLHKTDSADDDSLPPIRILISPPSLSPLSLSPFPLHLAILLPISPYLSLHSPVSGRSSALQFIRIIPSDRKPSFQPRSQSARVRREGEREGKGLVKFVKFAGSAAAANDAEPGGGTAAAATAECELELES